MVDTNPNNTSGSAASTITTARFPLSEDLPIGTSLRFTKYSRLASDAELQEKTTSVISLPLPITIPDTSSIATSTFDMGTFGNLSNDTIGGVSAAASNFVNKSKEMGVSDLLSAITDTGASAYNNAIRNRSLAGDSQFALKMLALSPRSFDFMPLDVAQALGGVVSNPHVTTLFKGVNLKSYHLEWRLSPRSFDETQELKKIIETIKLCTHPEEIMGGYGLDYPDLCYVEFTGKAKEYLPKYQRSFVTSIVASPDSMGGITLFESGAPTTINLQLSFTELNIVTRQTLREQNND